MARNKKQLRIPAESPTDAWVKHIAINNTGATLVCLELLKIAEGLASHDASATAFLDALDGKVPREQTSASPLKLTLPLRALDRLRIYGADVFKLAKSVCGGDMNLLYTVLIAHQRGFKGFSKHEIHSRIFGEPRPYSRTDAVVVWATNCLAVHVP